MGIHCINLKSKDFINLSKKLNISPANLEDIIHKYQYDNDTDEYPSEDYIKAALEGTRTEMSQNQIDLWERDYSEPKKFKTLLELNEAKRVALQFFRKEAISEYTDADGNYILKVAPPSFEKEYQEILAKAPRDKEGRLLAPNGKPSNLNERQYALVRTKAFKKWFGDWEGVNKFNIDMIDTSKVDIEKIDKPWKSDNTKVNKTLRLYLKNQHNKGYFELVKDQEFGVYSVHFKTGNADTRETYGSTKEERNILYEQILNALPNGAQLSTWGELSRGGVKALEKLGRNLKQIGERKVKDRQGNPLNIPIYQKGENISKVVDENGEPLVVYHGISKEDTNEFRTNNGLLYGIYFSKDKKIAEAYAKNGIIKSVFLNVRNLKQISNRKAYDAITLNGNKIPLELAFKMQTEEVIPIIKEHYDGVTMFTQGGLDHEIVVYNPTQIKSAESNIGAFSTANDRIDRFSEGKISDIINNQPDKITDNTNYYTQNDINYLHSRNLAINQTFTGDNIKEILESFKSSIRNTISKYIRENHYDLGVATLRRQKLEGNLSDKDSYYNFIQQLQDTIIDKLQKSGKTIEIKPDNNFTAAMGVKVNGNIVSLIYNPRLLLMDNERLDYILAHELVHAVTSNSINNVTSNVATETEQQFYNDIWDIIVDLNNNEDFYWNFGYDVSNTELRSSYIKEFIANVMTNPELQKHLAQIKTDKKQSLWSKFINAVRNLLNGYLGTDINNSYLEKLVNTISLHIEKSSLQNQNFGLFDKMTEGERANDFNNATNNKNDAERFANILESELTISSEKTILSNEELKYWNELGVGEMPRILVASERTDPAFHVKDILDIINGEKTVPQWGVVNGRRAVTGNLSGKDFAGLYLITKHDGLPMLKLLLTKIPKLLHFSITTLGGSQWEPGVMKYNDLLDKIEDYIKLGLDPNSVTIRIDPIVPGITKKEDIEQVVKRAASMGIKRIRFSIMDAYTNTREAMTKLGYDFNTYYGKNFFAKDEYIEDISNFMLSLAGKYDITLGTCAENIAKKGISKEGCLSVAAVNNMLGTNIEDKGTDNNTLRKLCSCYGGKVDALAYAKTCASHCIYCYAKHENDKALQYYNEDGTLKDNVYTRTRENLQQSGQEEEKANQQELKRDPFLERQQKINRLLDTLQESSLMTNTEIREVAEQAVYWISDHITELLENPELAVKIYGDSVKNLNTLTASRIEIVNAIGLDNIKEMCRLKLSPKNAGYNKISTIRKANLIVSNWDAIMLLASDVFTEVEKFSITETVIADKVVSLTNENINNNQDNYDINEQNDEESILEAHGNLLEHWQTKANTIDIMDSMSLLMHRAIIQCYQLKEVGRDDNNKPIYDKVTSEFGINLRVNPREVTGSILRWCQGCLNIKDVIAKLKEKEATNPWISLIITRLEDESGNESDFLSLFFGVFVKPFMLYSIVKANENGDYVSLVVNKNPALKEAVKGITTLYKIGEHPMFLSSGKVNTLTFRQFSLAMQELANLDFNKDIDTIAKNLGYMYNALGFSVDSNLVKQVLNEDTYKMLKTQFGYIHKSLYDHQNIDNPKDYEPFKFKGNGSFLGTLNKVLQPITDILEDTAVSSFYDNGNMYQSYIVPSYMTKLMSKFHKDGREFDNFITDEYGKYGWFKDASLRNIERGWKLPMLKELVNNPQARKIFEHKVLLTFNKHQYMKQMDDVEYTLAILTEYWSETNRSGKGATRVPAWFRVPMMSNKPSAEYIKFYSERGIDYQDTITNNLYSIFLLELGRILTVISRNYDKTDPEFIKNFDKNGKKFNFVDFMNEYLTDSKNSELGKLILSKLNGDKLTPLQELRFEELAKEAIKDNMSRKAESIVDDFERKGIFEGAKKIEGIDKNNLREELINFVWNDTYMSMNILLLTITDKAYYKDEEDLLKRLALIHAPGIRANRYATDYKGNPVTDGKMRTFYLKDFDSFISNIIDNISVVFDRKIANAKTDEEKKGYLVLKDSIIELFKKINIADAQGYSSPTSYRKKALLFGKWSKEAEDIYQKLITGNYTYSDLKTAFLPLKPFVYTLIEKSTNVGADEAPMQNMKVPILNKNSEYLLIMADAMLLGEDTGKPNLLRAIYSIMEQSSVEEEEIALNNGKKQIIRKPRIDGIDTVLFESTVKSGLRGAIDINQFLYADDGERQAKEYIESLIGKNGAYNETYVDEIPVEDYCLQLEVPGHFRNHELTHGSLIRAITPSDLESVDALGNTIYYNVEGRLLTAELFKDEYQQTIADNIEESIVTLTEELKLGPEATLLDKNRALEKILRREILSSPRYGVDLLLACTLNEKGEFRVPKGDPIQSKRIEQLLNSIIKNRVNKQEIAGGPVVQVSNFGTSRELNIRFKAKDGSLLMTREEFSKSPLAKKVTATSLTDKFNARYGKTSKTLTYEEYIRENQAGIAYFEVFAPIYLNDVFEKFQNPDGSIDMKAIEELNPDLLKMVGYRIPTEDKYSCAPLKIVGFLPREAGDAIMLPNDITLLTGSDFKQYWSH